ncbi:3-isopropylmalate dehydratase small subunit, partial [candidate division KSB1 bacterium]|nr:3-isopropylmalate dehydratase small subunit [candidate division KSB1 bacterium]
TLERLMNDFEPGATVTLDVADQTLILPDGSKEIFPIDPFNKTCLLQGVDQLGYLLQHEQTITAYERCHPARVSVEA